MNKDQTITSLVDKGFSFLRSHRYGDTLAVGRKLKRLRHSSAFEIIALAHLRLGALPRAIAALEEGVAKAGRVWLLWELLGNCYSDTGRYKAAENAYRQALSRERCDAEVVHLNRAIAFNRAGKSKEAWSAIRKVQSPRFSRRADAIRIRIHLAFGRKRAASEIALNLSRRKAPAVDLDQGHESFLLTTCASALNSVLKTRGKAKSLAFRAVAFNPENTEALSLIREADGKRAVEASLYYLLIRGVWNESFGKPEVPPGFFQSFRVAARDESTAFRLAKRFFPAEVRSSLAIEESKTLPFKDITLDGVYSLSDLIFYRRRGRHKRTR